MTYRIGIVGATGAVGQELIRLLVERRFPLGELVPLASSRSAGKPLTYGGQQWTVAEATPDAFAGLDAVIFSAGASISKQLAPAAVEHGCTVIDNSSAFRMDDGVPLVVPEVNPQAALEHTGIIANPNCSTAVSLMGLMPLHQQFGVKRVIACTYQAVSGVGDAGIPELRAQSEAYLAGATEPAPEAFPHPIAFNLLPQVDVFLDDGYTKEELKMANETRKILALPELKVSTTCVRVPVFRAHSIAVHAEFEKPVDLAVAREAIAEFPGAELCDEPAEQRYPLPRAYSEREECGVGRLRYDAALDNGLAFWVVGDQLWKGAALNAIQIAELLVAKNRLKF